MAFIYLGSWINKKIQPLINKILCHHKGEKVASVIDFSNCISSSPD
jgi:hypothetical protein